VHVTELRGTDGKNAVDSILRIIGTEEGATEASDELKTINPYISGLAVVDCLRVHDSA